MPKKETLNLFTKYFKPVLFLTVVIIFAAIYFLSLSPLLSKYQMLSGQVIQEKKENLEKQKKLLGELSELNNIYDKISPYLKERALEVLPVESDLPNLYYNLDQLAKEAGCQLLSINVELSKQEKETKVPMDETHQLEMEAAALIESMPQPTNGQKTLKEIKISLNLQGGGYLNLKKFLDLVAHNLRLFDITSFNYTPEDMGIKMDLKAYYYD